MKYSYNWLKELSKTKKSPKDLAELLTMRAFEFEGMKTEGRETQMEFSILPNRGHDALSHIGLSREICALEGRRFSAPSLSLGVARKLTPEKKLRVEIGDKKLCPRYMGSVLENIRVAASPKWMQTRLLASGVKPINNIVDITNYVMLETGQPMHAFDFAKLATRNARFAEATARREKPEIIVRRANSGEAIKLLDKKDYKLRENDLVIADSKKALALAGVMGGSDSSITSKTSTIILESANFNATSIRKTRVSHNIITESSHRFEREIDPNLVEIAMSRAIELVKKLGNESVKLSALTDVYPKKMKPWQVKLDTNYANRLLGENVPVPKMKKILENLGLKTKSAKNYLICSIPTVRIDLKTEEDLIEEIGRIFGYENIKEQPLSVDVLVSTQNLKRNLEDKLRDILSGLGFSEVMNYSFYGADDIARCNLRVDSHVEISNPLSEEQHYLRSNLITNILKNIDLNLKYFPKVQIFEIGKKFLNHEGKFAEISLLVGALADTKIKGSPFFELKGKCDALLKKIGVKDVKYEMQNEEYKFWHPTRSALISVDGKKLGRIGEISPKVLKKYGVKPRVAVFGLKTEELLKIGARSKQYKTIGKFPTVERDLSMFVPKNTKFDEIITKINEADVKLIKSIELFDVFEKEGEKSLALRIQIGSDSKTLTSEEIDAVMKKIISSLEKDLKVKVRK